MGIQLGPTRNQKYDYYPGSGLLQKVSGLNDLKTYAVYSGYDITGKLGQVVYGNNAQTTYQYDSLSKRLMSIMTKDAGNQDIIKKSYGYYPAGDIETIADDVTAITYFYEYDKLHRLESEINSGATDLFEPAILEYTYDGDQAHAPSSIKQNGVDYPVGYDLNGNMTNISDFKQVENVSTRDIDYNADNMPVEITHSSSGTTGLSYAGDGTRASKTKGSTVRYYIGEHFEVVRTGGTTVEATKYIFAGRSRIAMVKNNIVYYFHKDHLGSSSVMTDAAGNAVETTKYMPFGSQREHTGADVSSYKYTDQELDSETGLYNYNARLYDPVIGMFMSADSITSSLSNPQVLNRYAYCANNPMRYVDPSGHETTEITNTDTGGPPTEPITYIHDDHGNEYDGDGNPVPNPYIPIETNTGGTGTVPVVVNRIDNFSNQPTIAVLYYSEVGEDPYDGSLDSIYGQGMGDILPGVGKAVKGTYRTLRYDEKLHKGTVWGFHQAAKIAVGTHTFTGIKSLIIYNAAHMPTVNPRGLLVVTRETFADPLFDAFGPTPPTAAMGLGIYAYNEYVIPWISSGWDGPDY